VKRTSLFLTKAGMFQAMAQITFSPCTTGAKNCVFFYLRLFLLLCCLASD